MRDNNYNFSREPTWINKNSFFPPLIIMLFIVFGWLTAQDSLNVTWVSSCLGSVSYRVSTGVNSGSAYLFNYQEASVLMMSLDNPVHPLRLCEIGNPGETGKGILVDSLYYQAVGHYGLFVYNLANSSRPVRISSCRTGNASSVALSSQYAYVASQDSGLVVVDITDPSAPIKVGSLNLGSERGIDIAVSDTVAYVSCYSKLAIINIRDPAHPSLIGWWYSSYYPFDAMRNVVKQGNYVYLADFDCGIWVVDVSDPAHPVAAGSLACGLVLDLAVSGTHIYAALEDQGLGVIDCTNSDSMYVVSIFDTPGIAEGVCVRGNIVYVADLYSTRVVNVSDPNHPYEENYYNNLYGFPIEVALAGHYAYVAYGYCGLQIVDISEPAFPQPIGSCATPADARGISVQDSFAYVADGGSGLRIINIHNPQSPYETGFWCPSSVEVDINSVAVSGNYAYLAGYPGIEILDISNPQNPIRIFEYPYYCYYIMKDGDYIYVANAIINVADPYHPYQIGTCGGLGDCAVKDNYLYKLGDYRLPIYDISDKSSPVKVDSVEIIGQGLAIEGDNLYIGEGDYYGPGYGYQLHVVRITNALHLEIIGYYPQIRNGGIWPSYRLKVSGEYIYLPTDAGFQIYRFTGLPAVQESEETKVVGNPVRIIPNPFREHVFLTVDPGILADLNPQNRLAVTILKIYDSAGRLVKTITTEADRSVPSVNFQWAGRDEYNRRLPAGVYLYRLTSVGHSWTGKIVLIR
jgi:hypothetical protein